MRILVLVPALAALLASPAFGWTCPARGGPEWREYKTAHFLLDTDMSRFKVEGLIKSLETMRGLVLNGLFNGEVDVPGRVRVVAPASPSDFATLAGSPDVGAYFKTSWHDEPLIAMPVVGSRASDEVVAHELAHLLSHYQFPEQPAWFAEGLAAFLQTVAKPEEQRQNVSAQFSHIVRGGSTQGPSVGVMPTDFMYAFSQNQQVAPARELLEWRGAESTGSAGRFHLSSWLLYHWLWNQRGKQFTAYQKHLADGEDPDAAWRAAFPEYDPARPATLARLDAALAVYAKSARYAFYKVTTSASLKYTEAPLSSADVHLILYQARARTTPDAERAELDEALREDPQHPQALTERARLDGKEIDAERLRAIADARKTDFRAWLALARSTPNDLERRLAFQKAAELNPDSAWAQEGTAGALVALGKAKDALAFANRALDLEPWNPNMIEGLAVVARGLGKCAEALQLERRAVRMIVRNGNEETRAAASKRLGEMETSCKEAAR